MEINMFSYDVHYASDSRRDCTIDSELREREVMRIGKELYRRKKCVNKVFITNPYSHAPVTEFDESLYDEFLNRINGSDDGWNNVVID